MPKRIVELSDIAVRKAKPTEKEYKLFDGKGLFLLVTPSGGKLWKFRDSQDGKAKQMAFGPYPEVSLAEARQKREDARKLLANGVDPGAVKKAQKESNDENEETFEVIAREWHAKFSPRWAASHAVKILRRLELETFPWIGARPIGEINAPELLAVLRRIEARGHLETAPRTLQNCGQVFRYAVVTGRAQRDPSGDLKGAVAPAKAKHLATITDSAKVGELLRAIDEYKGSFIVACALRMAPFVFLRPGSYGRRNGLSLILSVRSGVSQSLG